MAVLLGVRAKFPSLIESLRVSNPLNNTEYYLARKKLFKEYDNATRVNFKKYQRNMINQTEFLQSWDVIYDGLIKNLNQLDKDFENAQPKLYALPSTIEVSPPVAQVVLRNRTYHSEVRTYLKSSTSTTQVSFGLIFGIPVLAVAICVFIFFLVKKFKRRNETISNNPPKPDSM